MGKYMFFELKEFIASDEAKKRGIDNTPTFVIVDHLNELVESFLDPLRAAWGKAISVRSGYRCMLLNTAVGGVATSVHKLGYAADLQSGNDIEAFYYFIVDWVKKFRIRFDQIFIETKGNKRWVHVGLYNNAGQQRGMIGKIDAK